MSSAIKANGYPQPIQAQQLLQFSVPDYAIQSLHVYENSALSKAYLGYRDAASQQLACGVPVAEVFGPEDYTDVELFFRDRTPSDPYNTCSVACEIYKNIEGTDVFARLVAVKLLTHLMRWMLVPTPETYAKLPAMIRPLPAQRLIPHSPCIDTNPHPAFREALMLRYRDFITCGEVRYSYTSVDWPYTLAEAVETDPITGRRRLTRAFEEHGTNPSNWSWKPSIAGTFPEIPALLHTFGGRLRNLQ
ncbi:uncharacterized protein K452DRAFT_295174 [Aplosporella prunicola CBS 121167]|uniref:Uncharacterized protein n=1 Tax=Aplosporella prunicola CBS 121167 TaxID=1176127 RepID=A0A6A6BN84_9PEZI|nr:uncharacterized protein K452DRAFT_295174 [Aplosporella prunicola CBS 121167]KAF2145562.1 hypothetical protein K452DRAFT_295174 [Aplosporella prunicola CBS 121167]